jgi:hypothetical protein
MARKLRDALPGGDQPLRGAVWTFLRPILSPRLTALNREAFVHDAGIESSVDLAAHRADADLDELDLGDDIPDAVTQRSARAYDRRQAPSRRSRLRGRSFASGPGCRSLPSRRWASPAPLAGSRRFLCPETALPASLTHCRGQRCVAAARCPVAWKATASCTGASAG